MTPTPTLAQAAAALLADFHAQPKHGPTLPQSVVDCERALAAHDAMQADARGSFVHCAEAWLRETLGPPDADPFWDDEDRASLAALLASVDRRRMERDVEACRGVIEREAMSRRDMGAGDADKAIGSCNRAIGAEHCEAAILAMPVEG